MQGRRPREVLLEPEKCEKRIVLSLIYKINPLDLVSVTVANLNGEVLNRYYNACVNANISALLP